MKINNSIPFLKQYPLFYQTLPFYGKNLTPLFLEKCENSNQPLSDDLFIFSDYRKLFNSKFKKRMSKKKVFYSPGDEICSSKESLQKKNILKIISLLICSFFT